VRDCVSVQMEAVPEQQLRDRITFSIEADSSTHGRAHVHETASVIKGFDKEKGRDDGTEDSGRSDVSETDGPPEAREHVVVDIRVEGPKPKKSHAQMLMEEDFYTLPFHVQLRIYFRKMRVSLSSDRL
jgi:hypothetical protein